MSNDPAITPETAYRLVNGLRCLRRETATYRLRSGYRETLYHIVKGEAVLLNPRDLEDIQQQLNIPLADLVQDGLLYVYSPLQHRQYAGTEDWREVGQVDGTPVYRAVPLGEGEDENALMHVLGSAASQSELLIDLSALEARAAQYELPHGRHSPNTTPGRNTKPGRA